MPSRAFASRCAYLAVLLFIVGILMASMLGPLMNFTPPPSIQVTVVSLAFSAFHLSLIPVVAALPSPEWARATGYAWIAIDNVLVFMGFFGVGAEVIVPARWGVHLACATWMFGASASGSGGVKTVGYLAAAALVVVSYVGPFIGTANVQPSLGPAALLLIIWLVLVGRELGR
jgi:hypothetical protein